MLYHCTYVTIDQYNDVWRISPICILNVPHILNIYLLDYPNSQCTMYLLLHPIHYATLIVSLLN